MAITSSFFCCSPCTLSVPVEPCRLPQPGHGELPRDALAGDAEPHEQHRELARRAGMGMLALEDESVEVDQGSRQAFCRVTFQLPLAFLPGWSMRSIVNSPEMTSPSIEPPKVVWTWQLQSGSV